MSQIVKTQNLTQSHDRETRKKGSLSFLNVARSILVEIGAVVAMVSLANKLAEGNVSAALLIASAGAGVVLGSFVVFHLYVGKKAH